MYRVQIRGVPHFQVSSDWRPATAIDYQMLKIATSLSAPMEPINRNEPVGDIVAYYNEWPASMNRWVRQNRQPHQRQQKWSKNKGQQNWCRVETEPNRRRRSRRRRRRRSAAWNSQYNAYFYLS